MKNKIEIDFFELQILIERCFNSSTVLSMSVIEKAIDTWFFQLDNEETERVYENICRHNKIMTAHNADGTKQLTKLSYDNNVIALDNDFQKKFIARYNPDNQYLVTATNGEKTETIQCFLYENEYHIGTRTTFQEKYITKIVKV